MVKPNHRGGFRARVAYAIRAIERSEESGAFEGCFESHDGAAVVCAIMRDRADLAPYGLTAHGVACWEETARRYAGQDLDALSVRLTRESKAAWSRQIAELQGQGVLL